MQIINGFIKGLRSNELMKVDRIENIFVGNMSKESDFIVMVSIGNKCIPISCHKTNELAEMAMFDLVFDIDKYLKNQSIENEPKINGELK